MPECMVCIEVSSQYCVVCVQYVRHTVCYVLASTRLEDPSKRGRPNRHQSIPAPRERGLIQPMSGVLHHCHHLGLI